MLLIRQVCLLLSQIHIHLLEIIRNFFWQQIHKVILCSWSAQFDCSRAHISTIHIHLFTNYNIIDLLPHTRKFSHYEIFTAKKVNRIFTIIFPRITYKKFFTLFTGNCHRVSVKVMVLGVEVNTSKLMLKNELLLGNMQQRWYKGHSQQ